MNIEDQLAKYKSWLPDEPHLGMIRHTLLHGWAHIEMDEECSTPFWINNHGGRIPLQDVRWEPSIGGSESISSNDFKGNKYGTVCDSVDAISNALNHHKPEAIKKYITDIADMIKRMKKREVEMKTALFDIHSSLISVLSIKPFDSTKIEKILEEINCATTSSKFDDLSNSEHLLKEIKDDAEQLENNLRQFMKTAVRIGTLYEKIKGDRNWDEKLMKEQGII
jgi:hypothetical protein